MNILFIADHRTKDFEAERNCAIEWAVGIEFEEIVILNNLYHIREIIIDETPKNQIIIIEEVEKADIVVIDYGGMSIFSCGAHGLIDHWNRFFIKLIEEHPNQNWFIASNVDMYDPEDRKKLEEIGVKFKWGMLDMEYTKSETNNAIITTLTNVRKHPNADRLKLATVLGTQVVVGLESNEGDIVLYFDSNLCLSNEYLSNNNLYSKPELNIDKTKNGYFDNNGRVKAQKLRGELSNGFVAPPDSLAFIKNPSGFVSIPTDMKIGLFSVGTEFTHINDIEICKKYVINSPGISGHSGKKKSGPKSTMFHQHWDTKQLMRELASIPTTSQLYVEEKIHGTSGRTGKVLCDNNKKWWQIWKECQVWKVLSGTRRRDSIEAHLPGIRREIEGMVAASLHKGEEIYYEIYGYSELSEIQKGFTYGCNPNVYKVMLYRVTITTPDGYCVDLDRESVYKRAEELSLEKPTLLSIITQSANGLMVTPTEKVIELVKSFTMGQSALDPNTLREGVVIWFKSHCGSWTCLKHKSEESLILESKQRDDVIGDPEDSL